MVGDAARGRTGEGVQHQTCGEIQEHNSKQTHSYHADPVGAADYESYLTTQPLWHGSSVDEYYSQPTPAPAKNPSTAKPRKFHEAAGRYKD